MKRAVREGGADYSRTAKPAKLAATANRPPASRGEAAAGTVDWTGGEPVGARVAVPLVVAGRPVPVEAYG